MKKSPTASAILALLFGPVGYLYFGWQYTVVAFVVMLASILPIDLLWDVNFRNLYFRLAVLAVLAYTATRIAYMFNARAEDERHEAYDTVGFAIVAVLDVSRYIVPLAIFFSGLDFSLPSPMDGMALIGAMAAGWWVAALVHRLVFSRYAAHLLRGG